MNPRDILLEEDPVVLTAIEAAVKRAEKLDARRQKALAIMVASEVVSRIKIK